MDEHIDLNKEINEEITEEKQKKPRKKDQFLSPEKREQIIKQLTDRGEKVDGLNDIELLELLSSAFDKISNADNAKKVEGLKFALNHYMKAPGCLLTDKDFVSRLYHLNVSEIYLRLFRNEDSILKDYQIWERVRHSGITVMREFSDINKRRSRRPILKKRKPVEVDDYVETRLYDGH